MPYLLKGAINMKTEMKTEQEVLEAIQKHNELKTGYKTKSNPSWYRLEGYVWALEWVLSLRESS